MCSARDDFARRSEIGVGKRRRLDVLARRDRDGEALAKRGEHVVLRVGLGEMTGDEELRCGCGPGCAEGLEAVVDGDLFERRTQQIEHRLGSCENLFVVDRARETHGQAVRAAGRRGAHGFFEAVDDGSGDLLQFRRCETELHRATQLLFADGQGLAPAIGRTGQFERGDIDEVVVVAGVGARVSERGVLLFRQAFEAAVQDRQREIARQVTQAIGASVGLFREG